MSFASLLLIVTLSFLLGMFAGIKLYCSIAGWLDRRRMSKVERAWNDLETA